MKKLGVYSLLLALSVFFIGCPPPPPDPYVHYICFGDSATEGMPEGRYPSFLEQMLIDGAGEEPGCVANQGQWGEVACGSQGRLLERINEALCPNAHTVLYWEGANDLMWYIYYNNWELDHGPTPEDIAEIHHIIFDCISEAVDLIQLEGLAVIVGTYYYLVPGVDVFGWGETTQEQIDFANRYIDEFNNAIISLADEEGIPVAPIHTLGVLGDGSDVYYLPDGAHPNVAGYELIAQIWYETIVGSQ